MAHVAEEVRRVSDVELVSRVEQLVRADRSLSAKLLVHLGELDERKLFLERGYTSMHDYCQVALGMSEAEAALRIYAARIGRRFPLVLERLGAGVLHLTGIRLLGPLLTEANHVQLLDRAKGRTKEQLQILVAEVVPKPDVPAQMRKLPAQRATSESAVLALPAASLAIAAQPAEAGTPEQPSAAEVAAAPASTSAKSTFALQSPREKASSLPLSPGRFKLVVTVGQDTHDNLAQLRELMRHQNPTGDLALIVERALSELLERV